MWAARIGFASENGAGQGRTTGRRLNRMKPHALVLVGAALLLAADTPKEDAARKELKKLQGTWTAVESQMEGLKDTKIHVKLQWVFQGKELFVKSGDKRVKQGSVEVDPSRKPKTIDLLIEGKPVLLGIYELKGDTLTVCWAGKERPKEFKAKGNTVVNILKREKP
jgi:uncharacterized protein (TIGR03067 family)